MSTCEDCGAHLDTRTCVELFLDLLALDHSRQPPWGPLHGVVTSAFFLQHPSDPRATPAQQAFGLSLIHDYLRGGQAAVTAAAEGARAANNHRATDRTRVRRTGGRPTETTGAQPAAQPSEPVTTTTIHDVAVDGTFPAAGYEERVRRWARFVAFTGAAPGRG
ncbi:DUF5946 family protein [Kineococcus arenarius]|uniref:DUF5946 family protein n=1 Tax=unclassified Kineococcus TaxID=2621656 RepID=UPI003D7E832E